MVVVGNDGQTTMGKHNYCELVELFPFDVHFQYIDNAYISAQCNSVIGGIKTN